MDINSPRALRMRLIVAELLARPGAGPLAPRYFERLRPPPRAMASSARADVPAVPDTHGDPEER